MFSFFSDEKAAAFLSGHTGMTRDHAFIPPEVYLRLVRFGFQCASSISRADATNPNSCPVNRRKLRSVVLEGPLFDPEAPPDPLSHRCGSVKIIEFSLPGTPNGKTTCPCGSDDAYLKWNRAYGVPSLTFLNRTRVGVVHVFNGGEIRDTYGFGYEAHCRGCNSDFLSCSPSSLGMSPTQVFDGPYAVTDEVCCGGMAREWQWLGRSPTDQIRIGLYDLTATAQARHLQQKYKEAYDAAIYHYMAAVHSYTTRPGWETSEELSIEAFGM